MRWKDVPGYEGLYQISDNGQVRNSKGRILKPSDNGQGYKMLYLKKDHVGTKFYVHRLVGLVFIKNPENKPCINHIDNNPANNNACNLEWCTHKENFDWMAKQGRNKRTKIWLDRLHGSLQKMQKAVVGTHVKTGETIEFDAVNHVVSGGFQPSCVSNCCNGKRATHGGYVWRWK